jgi:transposase
VRNNCINDLLNLKGVVVKKVENITEHLKIFIETPLSTQVCPCCNTETRKLKDYHTQTIKDSPIQFKPTYLVLRKRRYECFSCGKTFYEKLQFLPPYARKTTRLTEYIVDKLRTLTSSKAIAESANVSSNTVSRLLPYLATSTSPLPEVLCIDEFKGNTGNHKYQVAIVDGKSRKIVDVLECRYKSFLCDYFKRISLEERRKVKYFVTDMYETYRDIAMTYLPAAKIIVDPFHYSRYANMVVNQLRIEVQKTLPREERKFFKLSRRLLLSRRQNLKDDEQREKLKYILINFSEDLRIAYREKELLFDILHNDNSEEAIFLFEEWVKRNVDSDIPHLKECAKTYQRWSLQIKNSFRFPYSNGPTEGLNNKIKVLKRIGFGFRSFTNFKARILLLN